ncbi:MAG: WecB/TagA/CpsF family glycosyltransferase [Clostridiales bacterium]|nr:WecB/TagA/CpsF family glycosyltransferase [Clostridiales bacterium]
MERKRLDILGIPVDLVDMETAVEIFDHLMETPECSLIVTPNSEILVNATKDPELEQIIKRADLVIPDGIGLVYASKILGHPLRERVTGIDFLSRVLEKLEKTGGSAFFLGSKPGIAEAAAKKMQEKWPGLKVAGTQHGYFKKEEEPEIAKRIKDSGADFLCVALGSPKQEKFVETYKEILGVRAAIGVGGSLDVWAGEVKRAPEFYQKHGLEWLYRLIKQPSRWKRMLSLPVFMLRVLFGRKSAGKGELQ